MEMSDDIAERISEAHWRGEDSFGITLTNVHQHDACNHTVSGHVNVDGETLYFIVNIGNWNGFEVKEFGTIDEVGVYEAPEPTQFMFVPQNDYLKQDRPGMYKVYLKWKTQQWFIDKLNGYHYDRHFQPGCAIEKHYRDWAAKHGMKICAVER
jgi:hypothetical protein